MGVAGLFLVLALGLDLGQLEVSDQACQRAGEGTLVLAGFRQVAQCLAGPLLQPGAPERHQALGRWRRRGAGQGLVHQQGHGVGQVGVFAPVRIGQALEAAAFVAAGFQVGGNAGEAPGAQGLDPGLLGALEDLSGLDAGRAQATVQGLIMKTQAKRRRIGRTPQAANVLELGLARGQGQAHGLAVAAQRWFGGRHVIDGQLARPGHRL